METVILPIVPTRSCPMSATRSASFHRPLRTPAPGPLVIDALYPF
jgi:hypothetical protein